MFGGGGSSTTFTNPSVFRREEPRGVMFGGGGSSTLHLRFLAGGACSVLYGHIWNLTSVSSLCVSSAIKTYACLDCYKNRRVSSAIKTAVPVRCAVLQYSVRVSFKGIQSKTNFLLKSNTL